MASSNTGMCCRSRTTCRCGTCCTLLSCSWTAELSPYKGWFIFSMWWSSHGKVVPSAAMETVCHPTIWTWKNARFMTLSLRTTRCSPRTRMHMKHLCHQKVTTFMFSPCVMDCHRNMTSVGQEAGPQRTRATGADAEHATHSLADVAARSGHSWKLRCSNIFHTLRKSKTDS